MTDIELVIKIPKYMFEDIQDRYKHPNKGNGISLLEDAVASGIVLPKGHGDLKDIAEIERLWQKGDYDSLASAVIFAPTVIEADKEVENG